MLADARYKRPERAMGSEVSATTVGQARIHPTAILGEGARVGAKVEIGPYTVIGEGVSIGEGTLVGAHVVIDRDVVIGRENRIAAGVIIGGPPQHKQYGGERTLVRIGDRNIFGEYASISRAYGEGESTVVGNDNFIMSYVRVDHNCRIGNNVILVSGVGLAGHIVVDDQAYIGGQSGLHQFVRVGRLAMIAGMALVRQDVPPFVLAEGFPARARALNTVGLIRAGISPDDRAVLKRAFAILYRSKLSVGQALPRLEAECGTNSLAQDLIAFIKTGNQKRGMVRWSRDRSSD
jgi:UDP-N-acetylglucosamine acyltransferase